MNAWKQLTHDEKGEAMKTWLVVVVMIVPIMVLMNSSLIYDLEVNSVLASVVSGGVFAADGVTINRYASL